MAVVFMEGFDHLAVAQGLSVGKWTGSGGAKVAGRFGGEALRHANSYSDHWLHGSYSTVIIGEAIRCGTFSLAFGQRPLALWGGGAYVIYLYFSGLHFTLNKGDGTLLGTGVATLVAGAWYYIEIKLVVSATVGSVELRINGSSTPDILATGLNTGTTNVDGIRLGGDYSGYHDHDDLYLVDTSGSAPTNTFLGEVKIETIRPTSDGTNTAWVNGYANVDDSTSHDDDSTIISSFTPGEKETYGLADLATATGTVFAVQTNLVARKDNAGAKTIAPVIRTGGTDYDGTTTAGLSSSYLDYRQLYDRVDPSGADWTIATVNAMEAGVKEVA